MNPADLLPPEVLHCDPDPVLDFETDLEETARALDLEPWMLQRMKHPEREITVNLPLTRDDGRSVNVTAYRVQHCRTQGPSIGPVVLSPASHAASLRITAAEITLQSALLGLRVGGAAGAIVVDPAQFSERELRHLAKDYIRALRENIGPLLDVLAPLGNHYFADWMDEANTRSRGRAEPAAIAGKEEGLAAVTTEAMVALAQNAMGCESVSGMRVAVQGFGNTARSLAERLHSRGAKVIAIADRSGAVARDGGIDLAALAAYVTEQHVVFGFPGATATSNADVLECDCDLLILAAAERQIGQHNARRIRARAVLERTLGAVTALGEESLPHDCLLIPHILAGVPDLCVWAYEWQRGLSYSDVNCEEAERDACTLTARALARVREQARRQGASLRQSALQLAMEQWANILRRSR